MCVTHFISGQSWIMPAVASVNQDLSARGMALQVLQERFGYWRGAKAEDEFRRQAASDFLSAQERVVAIDNALIVITAATHLRERVCQ